MKVSKHHYALELVKSGSKVFFIEPPDLEQKGIKIEQSKDSPSLWLVKYRPIFRGKRFLPPFVFSVLIRVQIHLLIKKIGYKPDVLWSFSGFLFQNLKWFGAAKNLFFAADLFSEKTPPPELNTADTIIGVSDTICNKLSQQTTSPVYFIDHGLSSPFEEMAYQNLKNISAHNVKRVEKIQIGYIGNLRMQALDRDTMKKTILKFNDFQFTFWGSYQSQGNLGSYEVDETKEFIDFLKCQPNVKLNGPVDPTQLAKDIQSMDLFWLCWNLENYDTWDGSNSHKVLEYLSTGRPVVSHFISTYKNTDLLFMLQNPDNKNYISLFEQVIEVVKKGEDVKIVEHRIKKALINSYQNNLQKISKIIQNS